MANVALLIPFGEGGRPPELQRHLQIMQHAWPDHMFTYVEVDLMIIGKARVMLIDTALTINTDVMWFIDRDTFPPPHAGQLIQQALDLGIVSGLYFSRRLPFTPQAYIKAHEEGNEGKYWPLINYPATGLMVVDAVGGGMLAVRTDVFRQMQTYYKERLAKSMKFVEDRCFGDPYAMEAFQWLMRYSRHLSPWFEFLDKKGEDLYFCERAHDAGHIIWLNVDVKCAHQGLIEYREEHFIHLRDSGILQVAPTEAPGADELEVHGAEDTDENTSLLVTGPEALERSNDLPGTFRRIGVMHNLPGPLPGA